MTIAWPQSILISALWEESRRSWCPFSFYCFRPLHGVPAAWLASSRFQPGLDLPCPPLDTQMTPFSYMRFPSSAVSWAELSGPGFPFLEPREGDAPGMCVAAPAPPEPSYVCTLCLDTSRCCKTTEKPNFLQNLQLIISSCRSLADTCSARKNNISTCKS